MERIVTCATSHRQVIARSVYIDVIISSTPAEIEVAIGADANNDIIVTAIHSDCQVPDIVNIQRRVAAIDSGFSISYDLNKAFAADDFDVVVSSGFRVLGSA